MSSLRNAVQRRNHRERAQPREREKWGLLEKHKDYALRAKDHNAKKAKLRALRQKAADRNPDEFHFAMMSTRTSNGIKLGDRGNKALSEDVVKLLKTQDAGYLRTMLQRARKERERLEETIQMVDGKEPELRVLRGVKKSKGSHTVFVDSMNEQKEFRAEEWFGTDTDGLARTFNRPKKLRKVSPSSKEQDDAMDEDRAQARSRHQSHGEKDYHEIKERQAARRKRRRTQESQVSRLNAVTMRERDLFNALEETDHQRARMSHSIGGVNKNGVKFKIRERKR